VFGVPLETADASIQVRPHVNFPAHSGAALVSAATKDADVVGE